MLPWTSCLPPLPNDLNRPPAVCARTAESSREGDVDSQERMEIVDVGEEEDPLIQDK